MRRGGRYAARTSLLVLVVCMVFTGGGPWGGRLRVDAAASTSATVQVEYKGTYTATTITTDNLGNSTKDVATITWDFVWTGTLDQLILPYTYSKATGGENIFTPRVLTGISTEIHAGPSIHPPDCTGILSYNPNAIRSAPEIRMSSGVYSDPSVVVIQVHLPASQQLLRSSELRYSGVNGAGPCNNGDYRSGTGSDKRDLEAPAPTFSLARLSKKQTQSYSGIEKGVMGYTRGTNVITSSVSLVAASCTGSGSSNDVALLFGCYVALGDSYSAGQMPPFVPGGDACFRSTLSYAYLYDKNVAFAACSGATIADVLSTQILFVRPTTKLVTITIGGNDTGIIGSIVACLGKSLSLRRCENAYPPPDFAGLKTRLIALYAAIHAQAPEARIVVFGYPIVLPPTAPSGCAGLYLTGTRIGIFPSDVPYFYRLLTRLNDTVHQAAQASPSVTFVSPELFFAGHDVCSASSYFFPMIALNPAESLHPNAQGHAELASLLRRAAGPPPD